MLAVGRATDETLRQAYDTSDMLIVQLADSESRLVPIGVGGAVVGLIFGDDILSGVEPACRDFAFAEVFVNDAGRDELPVAHGLVVLVVVGRVGFLQLLPKFDEKSGDVLVETWVGVAIKQALDDAVVIGDNLVKGLHAEVAFVFTEVGQCFFKGIGRLAHGGDHQHDVLVLMLTHDVGQVAHGIGIFHRCTTEFIDFFDHFY